MSETAPPTSAGTPLEQLRSAFRSALRGLSPELYDADPLVVPTTNPAFGDYQCNAAMAAAKKLKGKPREVAAALVAAVGDAGGMASKLDVAGPGFINVTLAPAWVEARLNAVAGDPRLGVAPVPHPQTVVVDYSGPNVAKQMHVGHLRSTIIGDAVSRVLAFLGHGVIRQNHVGDWGTQFGMLIAYLRDLPDGQATRIEDLDAFYKAARKRFDAEAEFADTARAAVVGLQGGDADAQRRWATIVAESRRHFQPIYDRLGVLLTAADERGESFYNPRLPGDVAALRESGVATVSDGAVVAFTEGAEAPLILEKSGGGYGYATTDLAAIRYRVQDLHADRVLYFVGQPQAQHFNQVFATARKAGWAGEASLEHAAFGSVLGSDGKMFKARSGDSVKLVGLLDEAEQRAQAVVDAKSPDLPADERQRVATAVGIGAVKYADLSKDRLSDYVFDWDTMLSMDGNTAPYLQYAHARVRSIFRKAGEPPTGAAVRAEAPQEIKLAKHLLRFGEVIEIVARDLKPHVLCQYLYDLATTFSGFYETCPVLKSEEPTRGSRLTLCDLTARTLALGLDLLGIEHPDRM